MNDTDAALKLNGHKWKLYNSQDAGLLPDGQVARYIEGISHLDVDDLVRFLERFVDVSNYEANPAIRYAYCTAPLIDNQPRSGKWRHVQVRMERLDDQKRVGADGSTWRIIQVLAEGWLTSLSYADARLVSGYVLSGDGDRNPDGEPVLTLRWVGVDPDQMEALAFEKSVDEGEAGAVPTPSFRKIGINDNGTGTLTNPLNGGTFKVLSTSYRLEDDGSGTIDYNIGNPQFDFEVFKNFGGSRQGIRTYYWDVPESLATILVDSLQAAGRDCEATRNNQTGLINIVVDQQNLTGLTLDTGWYPAGTNQNGAIQKRVAWSQTLADAKTIADSVPATGNWFTQGHISQMDQFGKYDVTVVASAKPAGFSSSVPYKSYSFEVTGLKRQYRQNSAGETETRTITVVYRYAGNTSESTVSGYIATDATWEGVKVTPNGRGEYFQGTSYKITAGSATAWTNDDA